MYKNLLYILILFLALVSCTKKNENSLEFVLTKYDWYDYQVRQQTYNNANGNWTILRDTTFLVNSCSPATRYRFNTDHVFSIVSCTNPQNKTGNWTLTPKNFVSASVPIDLMGQVIHFGIEGEVTSFDHTHFSTSKSLFYYRNDNGVITSDSTVETNTYRNR